MQVCLCGDARARAVRGAAEGAARAQHACSHRKRKTAQTFCGGALAPRTAALILEG